MYVHKKCALKEHELDFEKKAGGFCGVCGQEGTIYHVKGTEDYYEQVIAGVLYRVRDGESENTREAVRKRLKAEMELARARKRVDAHNESSPVWEHEKFAPPEVEVVESIPEPEPVLEAETVEEEVEEEEEEKSLEDMDEDELRARLKELSG